ncbi:MAG: hypothetical protein RIR26_1261, partial [Pseudomonadota bacterium]
PVQNMKHLMLQREVREAVERGEFHIWSVTRVEEAFELLTGFVSGEWDETKQRFTPGTAFAEVDKALHPRSSEARSGASSKRSKGTKSSIIKTSKSGPRRAVKK